MTDADRAKDETDDAQNRPLPLVEGREAESETESVGVIETETEIAIENIGAGDLANTETHDIDDTATTMWMRKIETNNSQGGIL